MSKRKKGDPPIKDTTDWLERTFDTRYFGEDGGFPAAIPHIWVPGESNLVVVLGENASGKSFFRRVMSAIAQWAEPKMEVMKISMQGRREISSNIGLVFVYGDEDRDSTGVNSIRTVTTGINTCRGRDTPHAIIWDEPDIGLSDGAAASVGKAIADFAREPGQHTICTVVITHRKALVEQLLPCKPHYILLGDTKGPRTLEDWLKTPPTVRTLEEIQAAAQARFKAILRILNAKD